jgi:predicted nucleotidyltransferase
MGLFNYIRVEQELPLDATLKTLNRNWRDEEFQTKELEENALSTFILRDNKLYEEITEGHYEDRTEEEVKESKKFYGSRLSSLWKQKFVVDRKYEKFRDDYTGTFVFGCVVNGDNIDGTDFYPDWKAVVINGEVKELTILSEYQKYPSKDRIESQLKLEAEINLHEKKMRNPVYRIYFNYYVRVVENLGWRVSKVCTKLINALNWLNWRGIRFIVKVLTPR